MEDKKEIRIKFSTVVIIILTLVIVGLVSYIIWSNNMQDETLKNENVNDVLNENVDIAKKIILNKTYTVDKVTIDDAGISNEECGIKFEDESQFYFYLGWGFGLKGTYKIDNNAIICRTTTETGELMEDNNISGELIFNIENGILKLTKRDVKNIKAILDNYSEIEVGMTYSVKEENKVNEDKVETSKYVWEKYPNDMKEKLTEWIVGEKENDILDIGSYKVMKNTLYSLSKKYSDFSDCPFADLYISNLVLWDGTQIIRSDSNYMHYNYTWNDDLPIVPKYEEKMTYDIAVLNELYLSEDIDKSWKEEVESQSNDLKSGKKDLHYDIPKDRKFYYEIPSMLVMNGNNTSEKDYKNNARAKKIKVTVNEDKEYIFNLEDTNAVQVFDIDYKQNTIEKPVSIEVEVLETYNGEKTEDVYISDIQFSIDSNIPQGR